MSDKEEIKQEQGEGERLARFLAHAGIASRRHAEELIAAGRVRVNETVVRTQGVRIDPQHDLVYVDGKLIQNQTEHQYILLNKPAGYVSTASDPEGRPTVLDLLPPTLQKQRLYPVGRLDRDTEGLILLTNDGDFALRLTHPRYNKEKHYRALVQGHPTEEALQALRKGVAIREDNGQLYQTAPARVKRIQIVGENCLLALSIHEGRKRQLRRMLQVVGYPVQQLIRAGLGDLTLQGVAVGKWRHLTAEEVKQLL